MSYYEHNKTSFNENDFKSLLINKREIELALGVSINLKTKDDNNKLNNSLNSLSTYAMMPEIPIEDVICIFLEIPFGDRPIEYELIYTALTDAIENNRIKGRAEHDYYGNASYFISHDTAKRWAKTYGLNWNVPNYKDPNNTIVEDTLEKDTDLVKKLEQADQRIAELKQQLAEAKSEIANLKKLETSCQTVNYDEFSIYGYTSENLKLVFDVIKKLALKVDKENLHSYPTKEELKAFVKRYLNDNDKLAGAIYQIVIPENVKTRGRTPQGVETFKGFL